MLRFFKSQSLLLKRNLKLLNSVVSGLSGPGGHTIHDSTRGALLAHLSLCSCADCSARVGRSSASIKMKLGRDNVFLCLSTTDCLGFLPGQ
jgi:hypothetical protein